MSNDTGSEGLRDFSLDPEDNGSEDALKLDSLTQEELLALHAKIESRIGGLQLTEINLVKETLLQIHRAKVLQEDASKPNSGTPMNQRAQVQNSLAGLLTQLAKMQMDLYSSERIKRIQSAVIKVVKTLPQKQQDHFFDLLEIELEEAAKETDVVEVTGAVR